MRFASFTMRNLDLRAGLNFFRPRFRVCFAAIALTLPLAACSGFGLDSLDPTKMFAEKYQTKIDPDVPPEMLYDRGLAHLHNHDFEAATKTFTDLDKRFPFTQWQRKGLLMTTFSQYQDGKFDDAV